MSRERLDVPFEVMVRYRNEMRRVAHPSYDRLPPKLFPFDAAQSRACYSQQPSRRTLSARRAWRGVANVAAALGSPRAAMVYRAVGESSRASTKVPDVTDVPCRSTIGRHLLRRVRSSSIVTCKLLASFFCYAKSACAWCGTLLPSCAAPAIVLQPSSAASERQDARDRV